MLQLDGDGDRAQAAENLLHEIDNLAVLLHEVKEQIDKIEAAADAIGDAILTRIPEPRRAPRKSSLNRQPKGATRLRTVPPRAPQIRAPHIDDARP